MSKPGESPPELLAQTGSGFGDAWIGWDAWSGITGEAIRLDGAFTIEQLEALIMALKVQANNVLIVSGTEHG